MKILLAIICLSAINVHALNFELGTGISKHENPNNGLWYQREFKHELDQKSQSYHMGVSHKNWAFGYKYLGEYKSKALASASDDNYEAWVQGDDKIWPLSTWEGKGEVQGLYLQYRRTFGDYFVNAGLWRHWTTWEVTIPDWRCATIDGKCSGDYFGAEPGKPKYKKVSDNEIETSWMLGVGKKFGNYSLAYELWNVDGGEEYTPIYLGVAQNLELTYHF